MNDISGHPSAGDAITLGGVNLSLGRGAARVHILRDIDLNIGRGEARWPPRPVGLRQVDAAHGDDRVWSGRIPARSWSPARNWDGSTKTELARFRGRNIGIVFQAFHLIPTMTALENVAVPLELAGAPDALRARERELVRRRACRSASTIIRPSLSGGEQQRVALARALAPSPAILVADEPTGNLDESTGRDIIELLFRGHRERGTTLVLVTHDTALAARCDRVLHMHSGQLAG